MKSLLRLCCAMLFVSGAAQAAMVEVSLVPQHSTKLPGDSFSVDVIGTLSGSAFGFDGGAFTLGFNPAILDATSVALVAPWGPLSVTPPSIDNTTGMIKSGGIGSLFGIADGSYTLAKITFLAQNAGVTVLNLAEDSLNPWSYDFGNPVEVVNMTDGSVNVVPIPAAAWLMLSGAAFLGLIGRRRRAGRKAAAADL